MPTTLQKREKKGWRGKRRIVLVIITSVSDPVYGFTFLTKQRKRRWVAMGWNQGLDSADDGMCKVPYERFRDTFLGLSSP